MTRKRETNALLSNQKFNTALISEEFGFALSWSIDWRCNGNKIEVTRSEIGVMLLICHFVLATFDATSCQLWLAFVGEQASAFVHGKDYFCYKTSECILHWLHPFRLRFLRLWGLESASANVQGSDLTIRKGLQCNKLTAFVVWGQIAVLDFRVEYQARSAGRLISFAVLKSWDWVRTRSTWFQIFFVRKPRPRSKDM